jgi:hypothetical protein
MAVSFAVEVSGGLVEPSLGAGSALGNSALGNSALGNSALGNSALGNTVFGNSAAETRCR